MENIILPSTIEFLETDRPNVGHVVVTPCHQGYGTTLGNALRRVLLSSLPGAAVESIKIKGVQHEFSAVDGVVEDVIQIILNIKRLAVRSYSEEPITLSLVKKGVGPVVAGDFEKNADVEIMNPDIVIATITDDKAEFNLEVTIHQGRGYIPVASKETKGLDLGQIAIDSLYSPIIDVGYNVEMTRVGDVTNYEKLTLTIETNGTVSAKDAVIQATKILMDHFALILNADDADSSGTGASFAEDAPREEEDEDADEEADENKEEEV